MILNQYFKRPLFWDYLLSIVICFIAIFFISKYDIPLPKSDYVISTTSDLSTTSLTLSGFILTLLTVMITFKSGANIKKEDNHDDNTVFQIFFASDLYFSTVRILKDCVKSLVFVSVVGYSLKLGINLVTYVYLYYYNILSLLIVFLSLWRSLFILSKIIQMQKDHR